MTAVGRGLGLSVLLVLAALCTPAAPAAQEDWLIGRWQLVQAPEGEPTDYIEFAPDGRMTSISPTLKRYSGQYAVTPSEVQVNYKVGNESILRTLGYGPDRQRLYGRNARTGHTSVYEKRP